MERPKISPATVLINESSKTDPHTKAAPPREDFPILGLPLHVLSISILAFTRHNFGYAYLKPASLFIVIGLALTIFTGVAWTSRSETQLWEDYFPLVAFSFTWLIAYIIHCFTCHFRQWLGKAPLDNSSGISLLGSWLLEAPLAFGAGIALFHKSESLMPLGMWLMVASIALSLKESLNTWYRKRIEAVRITSEKKSETLAGKEQTQLNPLPVRKVPKARRKPSQPATPMTPDLSGQKIKFASVLGLEPPFTLKKAEQALRQKQKEAHSDSNPSTNRELDFQQLREAYEFFKHHYSE